MKELSIGDVLRYVLAGGAFLLAAAVVHDFHALRTAPIDSLGGASVIIGVSAVTGAILYSFHRALVFPFIQRAQIKCLKKTPPEIKENLKVCTLVSEAEITWDKARWADRDRNGNTKNLKEWADQIHFLYATSQALLFGVLFDLIAPGGLTLSCSANINFLAISIVVFALFLLLAGFVSHKRYLTWEAGILWQAKATLNNPSEGDVLREDSKREVTHIEEA